MEKHLEEGIARIIKILFSIVAVITFVVVLVVDKHVAYAPNATLQLPVANLLLIGIPLLLTAAILIWRKSACYKKIAKFCNEYFGLLLILFAVLLFLIQCILAYHIYFFPGWDASIVEGMAYECAKGVNVIGQDSYYSLYPNNITITFVLTLIHKTGYQLGLHDQVYQICIAAGIALVNFAGVITALSVKRLSGSGIIGIGSYLLYGLVAGLSPWITIPYTDVYSILFPVLTFYCYIRACDSNGKVSYLWWLGTGLAGGFGYIMKPNAGIVLIAVVLIELVKLFAQKGRKKLAVCKRFVPIIGAIVLVSLCYRFMIYYMGCDLNENLRIGPAHYIMMGLNDETIGAYNADDAAFSYGFATTEERTRANLAEAKSRLQEYGFLGYTEFLMKKLLTNFNDGTFSWGMEGNFMARESSHEVTPLMENLRQIFWREGDNYVYYSSFQQMLWLMVQGFLLGVLVRCKSLKSSKKETVVYLSLLGIFAFVMLFEARGRYLYCMLPMYILGASMGLQAIARKKIKKSF